MKKPLKVIRNVVLVLAGVLLVILVALQVLLRPSVLTSLVNQYAAGYVDGDIGFREIRVPVF